MDTKMVFDADCFGNPMSTVDEGAQVPVNTLRTSTGQAYDDPARLQLRMMSEQLPI